MWTTDIRSAIRDEMDQAHRFELPAPTGERIELSIGERQASLPSSTGSYITRTKQFVPSAYLAFGSEPEDLDAEVERAQDTLETLLFCLSFLERRWIPIRSREVCRNGSVVAFDSWRVVVDGRSPRSIPIRFNEPEAVVDSILAVAARVGAERQLYEAAMEPYIQARGLQPIPSFLLVHTAAEALKALYCRQQGKRPKKTSFKCGLEEACSHWGVETDESDFAFRKHRTNLVHEGRVDWEPFLREWRRLDRFVLRLTAGALGDHGLVRLAEELSR